MKQCPETLTGINVSCGSAGGIKRVLIIAREHIELPVATSGGTVSVSDLKSGIETGKTFVEYKFRPQTASMTSTSSIDTAIGSSSVSTELALQFTKMEQTKRVAIQQAINAGSVALVRDYNNKTYILGYDMPIYASNVTAQTGQAIGDLNGYNLTLTDVSFELPYLVVGAEGNDATDTELNTLLVA